MCTQDYFYLLHLTNVSITSDLCSFCSNNSQHVALKEAFTGSSVLQVTLVESKKSELTVAQEKSWETLLWSAHPHFLNAVRPHSTDGERGRG